MQVTVVDVDARELISAWLLTLNVAAPPTTRSYDVDVPLDRPVNKKIIFRNPWDLHKRFTLVSNDETIMRPR
jgi:hypothetical protein